MRRMAIMQDYACPHCGKPGISFWRKQVLGPAVPATCRSCAKAVGVPWWSMFGVAPFVGVILVGSQLQSKSWAIYLALLAVAAVFMSIWHHFIPLVKR